MRKFAVALFAVPVLVIVYFSDLLRRSWLARAGVAVAIGAVIAAGAMGLVRPAETVATPPTAIVPLTEAAFSVAVATDVAIDAPETLTFSTPMDRVSVAAAVHVDPATPVDLTWDADGKALTITPTTHWAVGRFHTITVDAGALALSGRPLTSPVRAVFLTRPATTVAVAATHLLGKRVAVDSGISIAFDGPIDAASLEQALHFAPAIAGTLRTDAVIDGAPRFTFVPATRLAADQQLTITIDGVRDRDGLAIPAATLVVRTAVAPSVVRFRPADKAKKVARDATISVRFTAAMDRASTKAALTVKSNGKAVAGKVTWSEADKVLVFDPTKSLPYSAKVVATVGAGAHGKDGTPLKATADATFTVKAKPKPASTSNTTRPRSSGGGGGSSGGSGGSGGGSTGGSVGSGSWGAVERYYFRLMNCTRTGGWVDTGGHCDSPGGRNVAPLMLSSGITSKVSRPYAKLLAVHGDCSHFMDGNPGDRLKRAGYRNWDWAENVGCPSGDPYAGMIAVQRYFQNEKPSGGHYVNLMNAKYDRAGVGVWAYHGRVRVVIDFYHP